MGQVGRQLHRCHNSSSLLKQTRDPVKTHARSALHSVLNWFGSRYCAPLRLYRSRNSFYSRSTVFAALLPRNYDSSSVWCEFSAPDRSTLTKKRARNLLQTGRLNFAIAAPLQRFRSATQHFSGGKLQFEVIVKIFLFCPHNCGQRIASLLRPDLQLLPVLSLSLYLLFSSVFSSLRVSVHSK